jgi:hypothetical protein
MVNLIAPVGFACFFAYAWEFYSPAVAYAVIAGLIASAAVVAGKPAAPSVAIGLEREGLAAGLRTECLLAQVAVPNGHLVAVRRRPRLESGEDRKRPAFGVTSRAAS